MATKRITEAEALLLFDHPRCGKESPLNVLPRWFVINAIKLLDNYFTLDCDLDWLEETEDWDLKAFHNVTPVNATYDCVRNFEYSRLCRWDLWDSARREFVSFQSRRRVYCICVWNANVTKVRAYVGEDWLPIRIDMSIGFGDVRVFEHRLVSEPSTKRRRVVPADFHLVVAATKRVFKRAARASDRLSNRTQVDLAGRTVRKLVHPMLPILCKTPPFPEEEKDSQFCVRKLELPTKRVKNEILFE